MVGWHHWLNGHEFEQAPGVGDRLGSLACCSHKESDTTEWLNWWSSLSYSQCRNIKKKKRIINPSLLKCACALVEENVSMRCWDHQICSSTMAMPLTYSVWPDKSRESLFFHLRLYGLVFTKPCIASHGTFFKSGCVFPSRRPWLISVALILLLFSRQVMSNSLWPHNCSTPGFPVLHYLPEFAQTHVHWVSDAIQPSHPLLSPSSSAKTYSTESMMTTLP